jgi:hypothetical protein
MWVGFNRLNKEYSGGMLLASSWTFELHKKEVNEHYCGAVCTNDT